MEVKTLFVPPWLSEAGYATDNSTQSMRVENGFLVNSVKRISFRFDRMVDCPNSDGEIFID